MPNQTNQPASAWAPFNEPFEFISPLPLEECAARLESKDEPKQFIRTRRTLEVKLSHTPDGYRFMLRRDAGRNLLVEVVGTLESAGEKTYVHGHGRFSKLTLSLLLILLVIQFPMFYPTVGLAILGLDALLVAIFWVVMASARRRLVEVVSNTLSGIDKDPS